MIDNVNRTNDFRAGETEGSTRSVDQWKSSLGDQFGKLRDYAKTNPSKVLGGLAALAIGAGLMRGRRM